jgi:hypothetical protein
MPESGECPTEEPEPELCSDGSVMPESGQCPTEEPEPELCSDGSVMPESGQCPSEPEPELCSDGSTMPASGECPTEEEHPTNPNCDGETTLPPAAGEDGNGMSDLEGCKPELPENVTCPDGSALPMTDQDGNEIITPADCVKPTPPVEEETPDTVVDETPAAPEAEIVPTTVETPEVEVPVSVLAVELEQPAVVATQLTPAPQVLSLTPATPVRETAVLGIAIERGTAPLARTGAGDVEGQLAVALSLLALGFGLVRLGRRPAGSIG